MAALDRIIQGQSATIEETFLVNGSPFVASEPVFWQILDPNANLVTEGYAAQDNINPARWYAVVTFPQDLTPTTNETRYQLRWTAKNNTKEITTIQQFQVLSTIDYDDGIVELDRLQSEKTNLVDSLVVEPQNQPLSINIRVLNDDSIEIFNSGTINVTNPLPVILRKNESNGKIIYTYISPSPVEKLTVENSNFKPFLIEWNYITALGARQEYHFLYVVNPKAVIYSHQLRRMIDKIRFEHPNPNIRFTDVDLVSYLDMGLSYVNFSKPTLTLFNMANMPDVFQPGLLNAAAYCALSAQYLAEGQSAFNFSGQSVSLEIDRTQFIDSALQRHLQYLENTLPSIKKSWIRATGGAGAGGAGVLGINVGPSVTLYSRAVRYGLYRQMLINR